MPLETFARLATTALLSRSGFRIFGGIGAGIIPKRVNDPFCARLCSLTLYIFSWHAE
jgi:hypothetical protein